MISWDDQSGNASDLTLSGSSGANEPTYSSSQINGLGLVEFSGNANRMVILDFAKMPSTYISTYAVFQSNGNSEGLLSYANNNEDNEFLLFDVDNLRTDISGTTNTSNVDFRDNSAYYIMAHRWKSSDGALLIQRNGGSVYSATLASGSTIDQGSSNALCIGGEQDGVDVYNDAGQDFDGNIAEFLIFNSNLNDAQNQIINNYLSAKYNLTLDAGDVYAGDDSGNGDFDFNVVGIGQSNMTTHSEASSLGLVLSTFDGSFDDGDFLLAGQKSTSNTITSAGVESNIEERWSRTWYIDKTGTLNASIAFDFGEGINGQYPQGTSDYELLKYNSSSSEYEIVSNTTKVINGDQMEFQVLDADLADGEYTIGTRDASSSPLDGLPKKTWYSFKSGNWSDASNWTLDGSIAPLYVNPGSSIPSSIDDVNITNGRDITIDISTITIGSITVEGTLDVGATSGHAFNSIAGTGKIIFSGSGGTDNFPSGDVTDFADGENGGVAEIQGTGFDLDIDRTFNNLILNLDNSTDAVTLLSDYTLNGDFQLLSGEFEINDNSATTNLAIEVQGDVIIESGGSMSVGSANARHQLDLYGDFTNNGTAAFTNRVAADYANEATNGIVDVNFLNDIENQSVACNGPTTLYRIEIDKGSDATYILSINATSNANFKLLGYANEGHSSVSQLTSNSNALGLLRGTVKIGNNVNIDYLNGGTNYNVSEAAQIWVDGGRVIKSVGTAIVPYGTVKVSSGSLEALVNSGITLRDNGTIQVDGGAIYANQIRTSVLGAGNVGGYVQTGGSTFVNGGTGVGSSTTGSTGTNTDYCPFNLTFSGNVFQMTGGTLQISQANSKGGIFIASSASNINVSGGQVIFEAGNASDFKICSTAEFWDVIMQNPLMTEMRIFTLEGLTTGAAPDGVTLSAQPLILLTDFNIEDSARFDHMGNDLHVGRNFTITAGGEYYFGEDRLLPKNLPGDGRTIPASHQNTTYFNNSYDGIVNLSNLDATSSPYNEQLFHNVVVEKPVGGLLTVTAPNKPSNGNNSNALRVAEGGSFQLLSGKVDQGTRSLRFFGDVTNLDTLGVYTDGVTNTTALLKFRPNDFTIVTEENSVFGNFRLNSGSSVITVENDILIQRLEYRHGRLNIGSNNVRIDQLDVDLTNAANYSSCGGCFSVQDMIITSGNVSDGGLTLRIPADGINPGSYSGNSYLDNLDDERFMFPLGLGTTNSFPGSKFTPVILDLNASNVNVGADGEGFITVNPVEGELTTTDLSIAPDSILTYYWRVRLESFDAAPEVEIMNFFGVNDDVPAAVSGTFQNLYLPGKVLDNSPFTRSVDTGTNNLALESDTDRPGIDYSIRFNGNGTNSFFLEDANFSAGSSGRFAGAPQIFYTRTRGDGFTIKWNNGNNWTFAPNDLDGNGQVDDYELHDKDQPVALDYPRAGDVAIIGWIPHGDGTGTDQNADGAPHGITADNYVVNFAELRFNQMLDASGNPTARFYSRNFQFRPTLCINNAGGGVNGSSISGEGMFWMRSSGSSQSDPSFAGIDIGDFVNNDSSYLVYESSSNAFTYDNLPSEVPNLLISGNGWGSIDRDFTITTDVTVNSDFELLGDVNLILNTGVEGDFVVNNDLRIFRSIANGNDSGGGGELLYPSNVNRTVEVYGDLRLEYDGALVEVNSPENTTQNIHSLMVHGDLYQDSGTGGTDGLNLFTSAGFDYIALELKGTGDHSYNRISGDTPNFGTIEIDKGLDTASSFTFNDDFNLLEASNGTSKALTLENGLLVLNDASIDLDLSSGGEDFSIPSTAGLQVTQGTVNVYGDDVGIALDGLLYIDGGTVDMSSGAGNGNNYIEYSASGNAQLVLESGTLSVGSQLRRSLTSSQGILYYAQSGGDATFGVNNAPETDRGVFEILNTGSTFNLTGGTFTILRQNGTNPSVAALFLDPDSHDLANAEITIFDGTNIANQDEFGINSTIPLNDLTINGNATSQPEVKLFVNPLTVNGTLTIDSNSTLRGNALDLNLGGDFIIDGMYSAISNTTLFSSSGTQEISGTGSASFYDFTKEGSGTLNLAKDITVQNLLLFSEGVLNDQGNTIRALGNVAIGGTHRSSPSLPSVDEGILFEGSSAQQLTRMGTSIIDLGIVTINNANGVSIPDGSTNTFQINNALRLESGLLNIGGNLLIIASTASIEEVNSFSALNMIRTNTSIADQGVRIDFNAIASSTDLVFPVGEQNTSGEYIYTPVSFNITSSSAGSIRVRPVNEIHPSIIDDAEAPDPEIVDMNNALQYHWIVRSNGVTGFNGTANFKYINSDLVFTSPYDENNYTAARISSSSTNWDRAFSSSTVDTNNELIVFPFSNESDSEISGDYTAGVNVDDSDIQINGAIPDQVQVFNTQGIGGDLDYSDAASWQEGSVPVGAVINVNGTDNLIMDQTGIRVLRSNINSDASITVDPSVFGIRIGTLQGTGTLRLANEVLPAGDYSVFFDCASGGNLEYFGSTNYNVLAGIGELRNVSFSGTGNRVLPNNFVRVCEDLVISGPTVIKSTSPGLQIDDDFDLQLGTFNATSSALIDINDQMILAGGTFSGASNLAIEIAGDVTRTAASVDFSNTSITLNGAAGQSITGDFSGSNALHNVILNNSGAGVDTRDGGNDIEIEGQLTFTDGIITTDASNSLVLTSNATVIGGSTSSFVNGPLSKENIPTSGSFRFPVGKTNRYREVYVLEDASTGGSNWVAEYFTSNTRGNTSFNTTSDTYGTLSTVSNLEMWTIDGSGGSSPISSFVRLSWGAESGVSDPNNIRVVYWDDKDNGPGADDEWFNIGEGLQSGSTSSGGSIQSQQLVTYSSNDFTLGSVDPNEPLPVELVSFAGREEHGIVKLDWVTASELNNDYFLVEHSIDGLDFREIGEVEGAGTTQEKQLYSFLHRQPVYPNNYYRLKQVDFDGAFEYSDVILVNINNILEEKELDFTMYPNPTNGNDVKIRLNSIDFAQSLIIEVVNLNGRRIYAERLSSIDLYDDITLDFGYGAARGIYIVRLTQENSSSVKRLVLR